MSRLEYKLNRFTNEITKVKAAIEQSKNKREIEKMEKSIAYLHNKAKLTSGHIERIKADKDNQTYQEIKADDLRNHLYVNGFTFKGRHYRFYKRTASKSRQSQTLFILDELYDSMKEWSHIGLDLSGKIDVASLLAYESLVSSSLESTIAINPKNIFIIDDKFSEFECPAIEVGNDLEAKFNENAKIIHNIWDGQALMDVSLFEQIGKGDKGMALLRQHFFKSCAFNTKIQQFLMDNCPDGIEYDKWKLTDMFGNKVSAKDILLITTPSSLKFLKYAEKGKQREAFANWKKHVKKDGNLFGICKHEKPSKYGDYSFTSYQMINTLDVTEEDIKNLAEVDVNYIKSLQGVKDSEGNFDDEPFINYLDKNKELTNAYEMLHDMYTINPEIVRTKMFREYRAKQISNYKTKIKGGRLRQIADYCTVVSNPYEMLQSVLDGKREDNNIHKPTVLKENEIYTTLYDFNETYTLVRNPHNSPNNFFKAKNVDNEIFTTYFKFTKNIVVVNSIKCEILSRLNGMDMDSDTTLIFSSGTFNAIVDKTLQRRNYPVILNKITSEANPVHLTNKNIAMIDTRTAKSQLWIGMVTNAAQYQVSVLWDIQNNEKDTPERQGKIDKVLDNIAVLVVLSNVAIDYSKKVVDVDIDKALRDIRSCEATKIEEEVKDKKGNVKTKLKSRKKPNFWKYVSSSKVDMQDFDCPMDTLIKHINTDIKNAEYRKNLSIHSILVDGDFKGSDDKQIEDIEALIKEFDEDIKEINALDGDKKCQERQTLLQKSYDNLDKRLGKKKIKPATMYKIMSMVADNYDDKETKKVKDFSSIGVHLLNALYRNHKKTFLDLLKKW